MMPAAARSRKGEEVIANVDARNQSFIVEVFKGITGWNIYLVEELEGRRGAGAPYIMLAPGPREAVYRASDLHFELRIIDHRLIYRPMIMICEAHFLLHSACMPLTAAQALVNQKSHLPKFPQTYRAYRNKSNPHP